MNNARYRTSPALTIIPHTVNDDGRAMVGIFEFISNSFAYCSADALIWLSLFKEWKTIAEIVAKFPQFDPTNLYQELAPLLEAKFIALDGTAEADLHNLFLSDWKLGYPAALFHFSNLNSEYYSDADSEFHSNLVLEDKPLIPLVLECEGKVSTLENPYAINTSNLLEVMELRRTNRTSNHSILDRAAVGMCLFAGLGITGFVEEKLGTLPLSMTPSGGARNPFEAYIFVKRMTETTPGLYHYNALRHQLELVHELPVDFNVSEYFGNQDWVNEMAVVVVLVAHMERTAWKYPNGSAFRVVYLEAGHIAQNSILAATSNGLTACPTAALNHLALNNLLGVKDSLTQSAIYAFTIDKAEQYPDKIIPNSNLNFGTTPKTSALTYA
jgi:SagB-type dehydrogenase family enzyme